MKNTVPGARFGIHLLATLLLGIFSMIDATFSAAAESSESNRAITYPASRRADQVDTYHGTKVEDPYRWLEELDTPETRTWVEAQNELTASILDKVPGREAVRNRLTRLWNFARYGVPQQRGGRYFFSKNDGLQNQSVIYWAESLRAEPKVLLDPNKLSADGTIAISSYVISDDGKWMAYGLATAGSDWQVWHVREVATGKDLADKLEWVKFSSASWTPDNKGFFYRRYDEPAAGAEFTATNYFPKVYYHTIDTPQSEDKLIYDRPDEKEWGFGTDVSEDGKYLIISISRGTDPKNAVFYKKLDDLNAKPVELLTRFDAEYNYLGNEGSLFWFPLAACLGRRQPVHRFLSGRCP
jgi:prolyl oligopeptidase